MMRDSFTVGMYGKVIHEVIAESDADRRTLYQWIDEGKVALPTRDQYPGPPRYHVEVEGKWRWLHTQEVVGKGFLQIRKLLDKHPVKQAACPGVNQLMQFVGREIGTEGLVELAEQGRLLMADEDFVGRLGNEGLALLGRLASLDLDQKYWNDDDKMSPGYGPKHGKRVYRR